VYSDTVYSQFSLYLDAELAEKIFQFHILSHTSTVLKPVLTSTQATHVLTLLARRCPAAPQFPRQKPSIFSKYRLSLDQISHQGLPTAIAAKYPVRVTKHGSPFTFGHKLISNHGKPIRLGAFHRPCFAESFQARRQCFGSVQRRRIACFWAKE
jgi:hypothetical protein